jgi:hypothetical protein
MQPSTTEEIRFNGLRALRWTVPGLSLVVALDIGPRVLALTPDDGPNLFAELPHETIGDYHLYGGHRLWSAPEVPERTYRPDDDPVELALTADSISVGGVVDPDGIRKRITLRWTDGARVAVAHELRNEGSGTHELAPWAITQVPLGGVAHLPMAPMEPEALIPTRSIVLWPYTLLADPRLRIVDDGVTLDASVDGGGARLKIGVPNAVGQVDYTRDGWRFTKHVTPGGAPAGGLDLGATMQAFADGRCAEIETLGELRRLAPGDAVEHHELWEVARAE